MWARLEVDGKYQLEGRRLADRREISARLAQKRAKWDWGWLWWLWWLWLCMVVVVVVVFVATK